MMEKHGVMGQCVDCVMFTPSSESESGLVTVVIVVNALRNMIYDVT